MLFCIIVVWYLKIDTNISPKFRFLSVYVTVCVSIRRAYLAHKSVTVGLILMKFGKSVGNQDRMIAIKI